jgi:hypothetical protein
MHSNCTQCTRLWNEYALATRHFLKIEGRLRVAQTSHDDQSARQLAPMFDEADRERKRVRHEIDNHEDDARTRTAGVP